jgi:hypothetical protein
MLSQNYRAKNKIKIALLFSGQVREINPQIFNKGLKIFCEGVDFKIYISCWDVIGSSMDHTPGNLSDHFMSEKKRVEEQIFNSFKGFPIEKFEIESYDKWKLSLTEPYLSIQNNPNYSELTRNSLPQLYQLKKSYELCIDDYSEFDYFVRCRFDSVFVCKFLDSIYGKEKKADIFHINFGKAHYSNRVYDIFFIAKPLSAHSIFRTWDNIESLIISNNFESELDRRDACRLLYASALNSGFFVGSTNSRVCEVYRVSDKYFKNLIIWGLVDREVPKIILFRILCNLIVIANFDSLSAIKLIAFYINTKLIDIKNLIKISAFRKKQKINSFISTIVE